MMWCLEPEQARSGERECSQCRTASKCRSRTSSACSWASSRNECIWASKADRTRRSSSSTSRPASNATSCAGPNTTWCTCKWRAAVCEWSPHDRRALFCRASRARPTAAWACTDGTARRWTGAVAIRSTCRTIWDRVVCAPRITIYAARYSISLIMKCCISDLGSV